MWRVFKESVWDFLWGKVVSVLGIIGTAQTLISLFEPSYAITIANVFKIDYRVWFIFTMVLALLIIFRVLHTAKGYKNILEAKDKIEILYNEKYQLSYRQKQNENEEVIRVGIRVRGKEAVENLEVFPSLLGRISKVKSYKRKKINRFPLSPMYPDMLLRPINPGGTPTCFVNLFKHRLGTCEIAFCYRDSPTEYMELSIGKYELDVMARGSKNQHGFRQLTISFDSESNLKVIALKGVEI